MPEPSPPPDSLVSACKQVKPHMLPAGLKHIVTTVDADLLEQGVSSPGASTFLAKGARAHIDIATHTEHVSKIWEGLST